jgi:hypothetical protein
MLKIWLTWLQPSLGVFGVMLVLTSPLLSLAAQKPSTVNRASKAIKSKSVVASATKAPTGVELAGIAATPDLAVRQLAVSALDSTNSNASTAAAKTRQQSNRDAVDSFLTPSTPKVAAIKTTKPKSVKSPVNTALARTTPIKPTVPVTGIFIGNSEVRGASKYSPDTSRSIQPIASVEIGAPTPISAMVGASSKIASPYPVVRPETMQKLAKNPALANTLASQPLNPIATLPSSTKQVSPAFKSVATVPANVKTTQSLKPTTTKLDRVAPQSLDPIAKIPATFHQEVPNSLDPIASIPSGLQRLLGNKLNDTRPAAAPVRVAKAIAPKANPLKTSPILALDNLVSPTTSTVSVLSGSSLQLATAQSYVSVPKFDIPGERLATVTLAKPATANISAKRLQKATFIAKVQPKADYLSHMTARQFEPHTKKSWTFVGQRNNLGGLILGSQPQNTFSNKIGMLPTNTSTTAGSRGLSGINRRVIN